MAVLELAHISHRYTLGGLLGGRRSNRVLFDVSISLDKGSSIALVGESGCGKTTLGKIAADVVRATEGSVRYHGCDIHQMGKADYMTFRRGVQFVHQEPYASLNPTHTVADTLYTQALIAAVPAPDPTLADLARPLPVLDAEPPASPATIVGCKFHPRCPYADDLSRRQVPALEEFAPGHRVACFHARELMESRDRPVASRVVADDVATLERP